MDCLERATNELIHTGFLPESKFMEALQVAKQYAKRKGVERVQEKLDDLAQLRTQPKNPIAYMVRSFKGLPEYRLVEAINKHRAELEKERARLIEIVRTKWIDDDD